jgi:large subunit ribosomal protein L29
MKYIDIKDKSLNELEAMLKEKTMQLTNTSELRDVKKDIARIQTAITAVKA